MKRLEFLLAFLFLVCTSLSAQSLYDSNSTRQIDRHGGNYFWLDNGENLTDIEYASILMDGNLYETFRSAQKQFNTGKGLLYMGLICLGASVFTLSTAMGEDINGNTIITNENCADLAVVLAYGADIGICLGCIFKGIGKGRLEWVKDTYNSGKNVSSRISLSPSLMMTAQRDMGYGATLSLSF